MRANYHTHCDFCDGRASAEIMAGAAAAAPAIISALARPSQKSQ